MYRITRITDRNGVDKHGPDVVKLLGRIIDENKSNIMVGYSGYLICTNDKSIYTTTIHKLTRGIDSMVIETKNSRYYMERIIRDG